MNSFGYLRQICRGLSSRKREKFLEKQRAFQIKQRKLVGLDSDLPDFSVLLRQFYKKAHPDLIRSSNPELAEINGESFQYLNGILSTIKTNTEYPPSLKKKIPFHIRNTDGTYTMVELTLNIGGGDCRNALGNSFQQFFMQAGISDKPFNWGEYFP